MTGQFQIHPDMDALMAAKNALTPEAGKELKRSEWNNYGAKLARPYPKGMQVEDVALDTPGFGRDGKIKVRVYRPEGRANPAPCVIFLHGGAFIKGSLDSGDSNAWGVSDQTGAVVVSVDYRLAPEFIYPAALHDCHAVAQFLFKNPAMFGIDPQKIALWGESAGGNLAAATALYARDQGGPHIAAQVLIYSPLSDELNGFSRQNFGKGFGLDSGFSSWDAYLGGKRPTSEPYAAPLKTPDVSNLPPAFVHFAEYDPLADDSRAYAKRLETAGSPVTLRCAERMIHGFIRARFSGPTAEKEFDLPCEFLRNIFKK